MRFAYCTLQSDRDFCPNQRPLVPEKPAFLPSLLTNLHNRDTLLLLVLQETTMRWTLKPGTWRALLLRTLLLTALWLLVAFVFATEFYLSARGMPMNISWMDAARGAVHD